MRRFIYTFLAIWFIHLPVNGQEGPPDDPAVFILSPGISYQGQLFGELTLSYAKMYIGHGYGFMGPRLGMEANFKGDRFIYAPKVGFELSGMGIALRGNALGYVDSKRLDLRILPEAGFDFFFGSLMYGYSIPVLSYKSLEVSKHRFSLSLRLQPEIWQEL